MRARVASIRKTHRHGTTKRDTLAARHGIVCAFRQVISRRQAAIDAPGRAGPAIAEPGWSLWVLCSRASIPLLRDCPGVASFGGDIAVCAYENLVLTDRLHSEGRGSFACACGEPFGHQVGKAESQASRLWHVLAQHSLACTCAALASEISSVTPVLSRCSTSGRY